MPRLVAHTVLAVLCKRERRNDQNGSNAEKKWHRFHGDLHVGRESDARAAGTTGRWKAKERRTARSTTSRLTPNAFRKLPKSESLGAGLDRRRRAGLMVASVSNSPRKNKREV